MEFIIHVVGHRPVDVSEVTNAYHSYNTSGELPLLDASRPLSGLLRLLLALKSRIDAQIQELEKYGYKGEIVKPS